ncbi:hypothetical protein [uncultured Sphingomonas sp.]|uniref:hypothetical protein n=1 Tax=uncultured Sphingomonas sp. TaxID=158754 RepID=UPI0025FCB3FF|nr:hypothetical protein [uncultured Sphingomonas sp.]
MSKLALRYEYDASFYDNRLTRDDFGRLSIAVETDRFSAKGGFWVQWQDVVEFGDALSCYPIPAPDGITAEWGFDLQEGDDLILKIQIVPADKRGGLIARFEVADDYEPQYRARGYFLTNYSDLDTFRAEIARLMKGEIDTATLLGQ